MYSTHTNAVQENTITLDRKLRGLITSLREWRKRKRQERIDRDALLGMASMDERMLRDIGLTRDDVKWATELPLSENAALRLQSMRRRRSKSNW